jgi:hypothetical protein
METHNKMKYKLAKNVKEVAGPPSSNVLTILKDLADQTGNFKSLTTTNGVMGLLDGIVNIMRDSNPKFVGGSQFKTALKQFYEKYR